jgi:hypothetical protein
MASTCIIVLSRIVCLSVCHQACVVLIICAEIWAYTSRIYNAVWCVIDLFTKSVRVAVKKCTHWIILCHKKTKQKHVVQDVDVVVVIAVVAGECG